MLGEPVEELYDSNDVPVRIRKEGHLMATDFGLNLSSETNVKNG